MIAVKIAMCAVSPDAQFRRDYFYPINEAKVLISCEMSVGSGGIEVLLGPN
jgi:hypothetical protein